MLKGATIVITLAALVACDASSGATVRTEPCDPAMREWILQCVEKANPRSDEPEDNTAQCERTAVRLFCEPSCFVSVNGQIACHTSSR